MVEWKCKICAEWNRFEVIKTCRKCNPTNNATSNGPTTLPAQPSARTSEEQVSEAPAAALDVAENELLGATAQSTYDRQSSRVDLISQEIDRSEALAKREEIVQNWNKSKKKFTDPDFPPETCSLYYDGKTPETGPIITFRRVDNIETMDENRDPWVVLKDPRATDIEQGTLGNCWFVSALAVVAERPELIDKILVTKDVHPAGFFQVRLFHDGRWCTLTIDDYLPCDQDLLTYSQVRTADFFLWTSLFLDLRSKNPCRKFIETIAPWRRQWKMTSEFPFVFWENPLPFRFPSNPRLAGSSCGCRWSRKRPPSSTAATRRWSRATRSNRCACWRELLAKRSSSRSAPWTSCGSFCCRATSRISCWAPPRAAERLRTTPSSKRKDCERSTPTPFWTSRWGAFLPVRFVLKKRDTWW